MLDGLNVIYWYVLLEMRIQGTGSVDELCVDQGVEGSYFDFLVTSFDALTDEA